MLIVSVITAYFIIINEKLHCDNLVQVSRLITDIRTSALFYNLSFEQIIKHIYETEKYYSLDFIKLFSLINDCTLSVPEKWKSCVEKSDCKLYQWEKDVLIKLCDSLCSCSRNDIENYCNRALDDIDNFIGTAREKKEKTIKTKAVFTISTGVMIALLFI